MLIVLRGRKEIIKGKKRKRKKEKGGEEGRKDGRIGRRRKGRRQKKKIPQGIEKERVSQVLSKAPCVSFINLTAN